MPHNSWYKGSHGYPVYSIGYYKVATLTLFEYPFYDRHSEKSCTHIIYVPHNNTAKGTIIPFWHMMKLLLVDIKFLVRKSMQGSQVSLDSAYMHLDNQC